MCIIAIIVTSLLAVLAIGSVIYLIKLGIKYWL